MKMRKKDDENCAERLEQLHGILGKIREIVFHFDSAGAILYVNQAWVHFTGYSIEETLGKNILEFILIDELNGISSNIATKEISEEVYFITKDKKIKLLEIYMKPFFFSTGNLNGYVGSILDITERKEQELLLKAGKQYVETLNRNLQKRIQEEVARNRKKDRLLIEQSRLTAMTDMISHIGQQWRHPLNSLSVMIQDIRQALDFGEMNAYYIDQFIRESMLQIQSMQQTIDDFRKFYRPAKEKNSFSLADSIEEALSIFHSSLKKHDIHVQFEYRGQQIVFGCPNEFSQVVLNVLTWVRDSFIYHNTQNRWITIRISESNSIYVVEIADNASSIHPALLQKVFDPYLGANKFGSGLGLYTAKIIMEDMNGAIKAENKGEGTCFSLTIPKISANIAPHSRFA